MYSLHDYAGNRNTAALVVAAIAALTLARWCAGRLDYAVNGCGRIDKVDR